MNKTLIVAAISVLAAGSAMAQSSVTIYGRFNVTAERQDAAGAKSYQLVNNASRIGFKGVEDLGGGLKAGFQLEHGFSADTGLPAATFWGRQSEVNLGGKFGMVRMGTMRSEAYYATADYISMHNHDTGPSSDALYAYVGRNNNKIAYRAPEFVKGLSIEGAVSAGENAPQSRRAYDFAANYNIGKFQLGLGAEKNFNKEQVAVRALAEFGPVIVGAYYQRDKNGYAPAANLTTYGERDTFRVSAAYNLGASEFHLNFGAADDYSKIANSDAKQFTAAYNYNLSKRTKVYTYYTKLDDSAARIYGGDFSSIAFGMRHNF